MAATTQAGFELVNNLVTQAKEMGIGQIKIQEMLPDGKTIRIKDKTVTSFSSCSYLGLEHDTRLITAADEATKRFGTQFSCSRAFLELPLFQEAEDLLSQIYGYPTLLAPTTSLGHVSIFPVLLKRNDAIILDHQVHTSVQNAIGMIKGMGNHVEMVRHNRLDILEARIQKLSEKHDRVWYMADGVYSMFGDGAPVKELYALMEKYDKLHCYYDDAHGMSWTGKNGAGYVLNEAPYHPKMILTTSLGKGFGVLGGALILPDIKTRDLIRNVGPTLMFSTPTQPSNLGSIIASAKIHLSPEVYERQDKLKGLMNYFLMTAKGLNLPVVNDEKTPIFYIGVGKPENGYKILTTMLDRGCFLNLACYPAVPFNKTGLRVTLTHHHTVQDIYELLNSVADIMSQYEKQDQLNRTEVFEAFSLAQ
jgi:7-keto-8-aminopelargonate synthetase-like enzyme